MTKTVFTFLLLAALVGLCTGAADAQNMHYVRDGASGNGTSWASAWSDLPATLERGHTYYIADGSYDNYCFNDAASGTQYIYIKKATIADHGESATWNNSYGDGVAVFNASIDFTTPYWEFSGQERDAVGSGHGFKINAASGCKGINITSSDSASHIRIKYVEIAGCGDDDNSHSNDLVYITKAVNDIVFSYCYLHDAGRCPFLIRSADGVIEHSYMARNESTSSQHSEGISAAWNTTWIVRYNLWEDMEGTGVIVFYGDHWEIYGNVIYFTEDASTGPHASNGSIATWSDTSDGNVNNSLIYNNTFVNLSGINAGISFNGASYANKAYNNIFYGCENINHKYADMDWNWYFGNGSGNYGSEAHGEYPQSDPNMFVDAAHYDYRLTKATQGGKDLGPPYNVDMCNCVRGSDGLWDRGCFEFGGDSGIDPPENLGIVF